MPPRLTAAWRLSLASLLASLLVVWHISLLWLYRETPTVIGGWLLVVLAAVTAARAVARRVPADRRTPLMRAFARLDRTGFVFVTFLLLLVLAFHLGFQRAASDGRSYFVQLRSLVMDGDLDLANDEAVFGGREPEKYPFGAALLWSPFYVFGHLWMSTLNAMGGDWRTDGYSYPYQRAVGLATLVYGFIGLILMYRFLRRYVDRGIAALSTLGICSTTFLIWYLTADNSMAHGLSMAATTLFLFLWLRFRGAPTPRRWVWLGCAAGIMTIVRWQDGLFMVLPVADLVLISWQARTRPAGKRLRAAVGDLARFGAAVIVILSPQLVFWKAVFGQWIYLPTREHAFDPGWIPPFAVDVLFSSNRGLLTTTPVVWLALIGLGCFATQHGRVAAILAVGFLAQVWVNGAVEIWWGGVGYGARRFANSMLVFAVGLAGLLTAVRRFPLAAPIGVLAAFLVFNVVFMLGYRDGSLPKGEGVTFPTIVGELYGRIGSPFSLPVGAYVAWRYDVGPATYDQLRGRTYNHLTIDVGSQDDERFLGHGWAAREQGPSYSFRWTDGLTSTVLAPLKTNADDYVLEFEWAPFEAPGLPPQVVRVELNNALLTELTLQPGMHVDRVRIPASRLRLNLNHLRFRYAYAKSPKELGLSGDARALAVQVSTIRFLRQLTDGPPAP